MKRRTLHETLVGAFGLLGILLLVLLIYLMGGLDRLFRRTITVDVRFPDVQGLQPGDPVYLFGLKSGMVTDVELLPRSGSDAAELRVELEIPEAYRRFLRRDSVVKIDKSITGSLSVLIQESDGPPLEDGGVLAGSGGILLGDVAEQMNSVLEKIEEVVVALKSITGEIEERGDVVAVISEARALVGEIRDEVGPMLALVVKTLESVEGIVEENRLDLRHSVANFKDFSADARDFLAKLSDTPDRIRDGLATLEQTAAALGDAVSDNRAEIDSLLRDLSRTASNAENLTAEVKRRPWRLLYQPSLEEQRALELYDAAWAYNRGASELYRTVRDLTARLEKSQSGHLEPEEMHEALAAVRASLDRHKEAEEVFWERLGG